MTARRLLILLLFAMVPLLLLNCGGDDDPVQTTPVRLAIDWAERSRNIDAPGSALSAVITLDQEGAEGLTETVNRGSNLDAHTQNIVTSQQVVPGNWNLTVNFHAQADGQGALVGTAQSPVTIDANGDGIGTVATQSTVQSVMLVDGQEVVEGETEQLQFMARDGQGNTVAVTPGSADFSVTAGGENLTVTPDGMATGVAVGDATVEVMVDGASDSGTVAVVAPPTPTVNIVSPTTEQTIVGTTVEVQLQTGSFNIVNKPGQAPQRGEGHVHYWLDEDPASSGGTPQFSASFQLSDVAFGEHTLYVELRNNDHTPLDPPVTDQVLFSTQQSLSEQFLALLSEGQRSATMVGSDQCQGCHSSNHSDWSGTRHAEVGTECESCHGPASLHVSPPSGQDRKDFILAFPNVANAIVCGQCHGSTHQEWLESVHDEIVEGAAGRGSATCGPCHSGITRIAVIENGEEATEERLAELGEQTLSEVPNTAPCASCHNPHATTGNLNSQGEERQLRYPIANTDITAVGPGASRDDYQRFEHLCARCHNGRGGDPSDEGLEGRTSRPNIHHSNQYNMLMGFAGVEGPGVQRNEAHANLDAQCVHCHVNQANHSTGINTTACLPCHSDGAALIESTHREIEEALMALRMRMEGWSGAAFGDDENYANVAAGLIPWLWEYSSHIGDVAEELGVSEEGIPEEHQASGVPIEVKRARHNYFYILEDHSGGVHNTPYAEHLIDVANENLDAVGAPAVTRSYLPRWQIREILEKDRRRAAMVELIDWVTE